MRLRQCLILLSIFTLLSSVFLAKDFPYRKDYQDVPIIELVDLKAGYDDGSIVIIDVRSTIEYETIHPKGAFHVSLANAAFLEDLQTLISRFPNKKFAVYCNGITCLKSYKAAQEAKDAGITNVYAFDAGIPAWTKAYPAGALLLGKEVVDPAKQIIPKSEFKEREQVLRENLLGLQQRLRTEGNFPVLLDFAGVRGAGKGSSINLLNKWMDARWIVTHAYTEPSDEERERPVFWRFWRQLPPRGQIGIYLSGRYSRPLLDFVYGKISRDDFTHHLDRINPP